MTDTYRALVLGQPVEVADGLFDYPIDEYNVPREKSLDFLQGACGGIVTVIELRHPDHPDVIADLWVGEEARFQGLPRNRFADEVAIAGGWAGREWGDYLLGSAVLTGVDKPSGETVSIPDEWVAYVEMLAGHR